MQPGHAEQRTHDYVRHGTTTLFAALDIATGKVTGVCKNRHRHEEFLAFLKHRANDLGSVVVSASGLTFSSSTATQLTTPQVDVTSTGAWLVSYWGAKSSSAVTLTAPASEELRSGSTGSGSGNITAALADSDGPVAVGTRGV
jgi:hypothetical protein